MTTCAGENDEVEGIEPVASEEEGFTDIYGRNVSKESAETQIDAFWRWLNPRQPTLAEHIFRLVSNHGAIKVIRALQREGSL